MIKTREEWLIALTDILRTDFESIGVTLPDRIKLSCGWPSGGGRNTKRIGQCWNKSVSREGNTEIFISPTVDDSVEVAAILVHELVHAAIGTEKGHGKEFKKVALAMGLTGKMRSTSAGAELRERLIDIVNSVGAYPHACLSLDSNGRKKEGTRLLKVKCPSCGYIVRTTAVWLTVGTPTCCCGTEMMPVQKQEDEDE